jgi:acyl-CoA thioester hydrolase
MVPFRPDDIPPSAFLYRSQVFFDELDPMQMLHNSRYATHVERATTRLYNAQGFRYERDVQDNPDQHHAVRRYEAEFLNPVVGELDMEVSLWVERLGSTSCAYGFACASNRRLHARGARTIVKLDLVTFRPTPWTDLFRERHAPYLHASGLESS